MCREVNVRGPRYSLRCDARQCELSYVCVLMTFRSDRKQCKCHHVRIVIDTAAHLPPRRNGTLSVRIDSFKLVSFHTAGTRPAI